MLFVDSLRSDFVNVSGFRWMKWSEKNQQNWFCTISHVNQFHICWITVIIINNKRNEKKAKQQNVHNIYLYNHHDNIVKSM